MTLYNVHLYREMRLVFLDIEADSPESAAETCREFPDEAACGAAVDCDGETFAALVDLQGDFEHEHSTVIEFEAERVRKLAPKLLAALENLLADIDGLAGEFSICDEIAEGESGQAARSAIAEAHAAGIQTDEAAEA